MSTIIIGVQVMYTSIWPRDNNTNRPRPSKNGKYVLKLNFNGCWRRVVIDDKLPVSKTIRMLHVIDKNNPGLLWPPLIEKAYLKVRGGYDFPGSNSCSDLWTLIGWIPEQVFLQEYGCCLFVSKCNTNISIVRMWFPTNYGGESTKLSSMATFW